MRALLDEKHREVLARFAWSRLLVAFDFDGTLAPITERPDAAAMRAGTRRKLAQVAKRYPVAVISGRAQHDAAAKLGEARLFSVSGNHGLEPGGDLARYRKLVARWRALLEQRLGALPGVEIEDKTFSLALHYRRSRAKRRALVAIRAAIARLGGEARAIGGKQVVNLVPSGAPHKGEALRRLRREAGCDTALYVGDDLTDEDVFTLDEPGQLLGVRVGRSSRSAAGWYLRSQREIDALLDRLLELRPALREARRA